MTKDAFQKDWKKGRSNLYNTKERKRGLRGFGWVTRIFDEQTYWIYTDIFSK